MDPEALYDAKVLISGQIYENETIEEQGKRVALWQIFRPWP